VGFGDPTISTTELFIGPSGKKKSPENPRPARPPDFETGGAYFRHKRLMVSGGWNLIPDLLRKE